MVDFIYFLISQNNIWIETKKEKCPEEKKILYCLNQAVLILDGKWGKKVQIYIFWSKLIKQENGFLVR